MSVGSLLTELCTPIQCHQHSLGFNCQQHQWSLSTTTGWKPFEPIQRYTRMSRWISWQQLAPSGRFHSSKSSLSKLTYTEWAAACSEVTLPRHLGIDKIIRDSPSCTPVALLLLEHENQCNCRHPGSSLVLTTETCITPSLVCCMGTSSKHVQHQHLIFREDLEQVLFRRFVIVQVSIADFHLMRASKDS